MAPLHSTKSAAAFLGVSEASVRRWSDAGLLPVQRVGRRGTRRFAEADLQRFAAVQPKGVTEIQRTAQVVELHDHLATFYSSDAGRLRLSVPFLRDGIAAGQRCFLISSRAIADLYLDALGEFVDADRALASGTLVLRTGAGSSARDAIARWQELWWKALDEGATGIRVVGEMASYVGFPTFQEMLDYEVAFDNFAKRFPVTTLCQYDVRSFDGKAMIAALQAHPDLFDKRISDFLF